ncbi:MAG: hypothetical protein ACO363_01120, partial [Balneolaceae bacterium]
EESITHTDTGLIRWYRFFYPLLFPLSPFLFLPLRNPRSHFHPPLVCFPFPRLLYERTATHQPEKTPKNYAFT